MVLKQWMYNVLIGLLCGVFLICAGFLAAYFLEAKEQTDSYDQLADMMHQAVQTLPSAPVSPSQPSTPADPSTPQNPAPPTQPEEDPNWAIVTDPEGGFPVRLLREFAQFYTLNNDIVGWIQVPGTVIDYPVMQTPDDPDYYLKRNFYKQKTEWGSIYVREECDVRLPSDNVTIYGHRMNDGSMFASLHSFKEKSFWEQNHTVVFNTLWGRHTYEIFAVFITSVAPGKGFDYHIFVDAKNQDAFKEYVNTCKELSMYETGIYPQYGDKLITLSTCVRYRPDDRLVVVARRVS